jgi:hypothetical protein
MGIIDNANILYNFNAFANNHSTGRIVAKLLTCYPAQGCTLGRGLAPRGNMPKSVADLCQEHRFAVAELAQRSGLDEGRVTAIALGRWTPSPTERQKIAAVFGVAIDGIAWGHKTPIQHLYGHGPG